MRSTRLYIAFLIVLTGGVSIHAQSVIDSLQNLDSVLVGKQSLKSPKLEIDTLVDADSLLVKLDSIKSKTENLSNKINQAAYLPEKKIKEGEDKVNSAISDSASKITNETKDKLSKKISSLDKKGINQSTDKLEHLVDTPAIDLPKSNTKIKTPPIEEAQIPALDEIRLDKTLKIPEGNTDDLQKVRELGEAANQLGDIENAPKEQLDKLKTIDEAQEVTEQVSQLEVVNEEIKSQSEELKSMKEGDLTKAKESIEKEAEKQIANVDGVSDLQMQNQELEEIKLEHEAYKQQLEEYKSQKIIKDQLKQKAIEQGAEFFAKHQDKLKSMQGNYGTYKKKFLKVKDESKRVGIKTNAMKGKSFGERLILGGYTQVVKLEVNAIDLSPIVGYKLSGLIVVGVGGTYRLHLGQDSKSINSNNSVYGFRGYADAKVHKGFYLHGEYESMRTNVPVNGSLDVTSRAWVDGLSFGIGKTYKIHKKINGYMQVLYNTTFEFNRSPYNKKVMFRIGLEGTLDRKKKSQN